MKILYVNHYGKTISGAERVMLNLAGVLRDNHGVEITALCPDGMLADEFRAMGIRTEIVEFVKFRRTFNPVFWLSSLTSMIRSRSKILALAGSGGYDAVFSNSFVAHLYACLPAKKLGLPAIWHMHDILKNLSANKLVVPFASKNADAVIAVSGAVKDSLVSLGADDKKIHAILNGMDLTKFDAASAAGPTDPFPAKNADEIHVAIVGQVSFIKGQKQFVEAAISLLSYRKEKLKFFIIGDIQDKIDIEYKKMLEKTVRDAGRSENIVFTGRRNDVPALLKNFDILVHASATSDSCPMVVLEYLYSGRPVIASRIGGVPELVSDGETGLLFEPGNAAQLEEKLNALLDDKIKSGAFGAAGKLSVLKNHTLESHAKRVFDVLNKTISNYR